MAIEANHSPDLKPIEVEVRLLDAPEFQAFIASVAEAVEILKGIEWAGNKTSPVKAKVDRAIAVLLDGRPRPAEPQVNVVVFRDAE